MSSRSGYDWSWQVDQVHKFDEDSTPQELKDFRDKWKRILVELSLEPKYPEKYAGFVFEFQGLAYKVSAGDFGEDDSVFARISYEIGEELVKMGAEKVFYTGMLD